MSLNTFIFYSLLRKPMWFPLLKVVSPLQTMSDFRWFFLSAGPDGGTDIQPKQSANSVVKNEGKQREKLEKQRERQEEKRPPVGDSRAALKLMMCYWRYCIPYYIVFMAFTFLLQRRELHVPPARQAKTSLFSGLECKRSPPTSILCHAIPYYTIPYHTIPIPIPIPNWGSKAPERAAVGD